MAENDPQPPPQAPAFERGPNMGVPGGAKIARPSLRLEDPLTPEELKRFEGILGAPGSLARPAPAADAAPQVLTCEDDPIQRRIISQTLIAAGCEAFEVDNGAHALESAAAQPLDLLILDLKLPVLDGYQVLRGLRSYLKWPLPVVLALSELPGVEYEATALDLGADLYLKKPFALPLLKAYVNSCLRRARGLAK